MKITHDFFKKINNIIYLLFNMVCTRKNHTANNFTPLFRLEIAYLSQKSLSDVKPPFVLSDSVCVDVNVSFEVVSSYVTIYLNVKPIIIIYLRVCTVVVVILHHSRHLHFLPLIRIGSFNSHPNFLLDTFFANLNRTTFIDTRRTTRTTFIVTHGRTHPSSVWMYTTRQNNQLIVFAAHITCTMVSTRWNVHR